MRLNLIGRGKTAHGAWPWLGENAIENLIADYFKIKRHFELTAPGHWHRTLNFSRIQAGKASLGAGLRRAISDIRFTENDDMEAVIADIRREIKGEVEVVEREPLFQGGGSPDLYRLLALAGTPDLAAEHGASDRAFSSPSASPASSGARTGDNSAHAVDEHATSTAGSRCTASWMSF